MKKAFTLIEITLAIALLAMVTAFTGLIFKVSIGTHRAAGANTEIMQKLRAITNQLNSDFKGLGKDGYLILYSEIMFNRLEYKTSSAPNDFRADRLYYFCTGDFQSWIDPSIKSNIARIYFGHDSNSITNARKLVSTWNLARDVKLISAAQTTLDSDPNSYANFKVDTVLTNADVQSVLPAGVPINVTTNPDSIRSLMCQNVGELKIEWTDGTTHPVDGSLVWFGLGNTHRQPSYYPGALPDPDYDNIEPVRASQEKRYDAIWKPDIPQRFWPKAIKFTFTLYDSKRILKTGREFTHIVYIGD